MMTYNRSPSHAINSDHALARGKFFSVIKPVFGCSVKGRRCLISFSEVTGVIGD